MDTHSLKRPPNMGDLKRQAEAQAPTLRAELRATMRLRGLTSEEVAHAATLDAVALTLFLDGASINPRWQAKLSAWLTQASDA